MNLRIQVLTSNIAGLVVGGDVGSLWERYRELAEAVALEVLDIQEALTGRRFDRLEMLEGMLQGYAADPAHACAGRSAPARLARALAHADTAGLAVPVLRQIAAERL